MGVELHITRTPKSADVALPITADEWLAYVASDSELMLWPAQGPYFVRGLGESAYPKPWLDWSDGEISSTRPDTALYQKMLCIAQARGARVRDDDMTYASAAAWQFDPNAPQEVATTLALPWWKRLF